MKCCHITHGFKTNRTILVCVKYVYQGFFSLNNGKYQLNLIKPGIYHLNKKPKGEVDQKLANLGNHISAINNPDSSHLSTWPFSAFQRPPQVRSPHGHKVATGVPDIISSWQSPEEEKRQHLTMCLFFH